MMTYFENIFYKFINYKGKFLISTKLRRVGAILKSMFWVILQCRANCTVAMWSCDEVIIGDINPI